MTRLRTALVTLLLLSLALGASARKQSTEPWIVKLDAGTISGESSDGCHRYLGIPFAAPPVGELRWKPPQPVEPWSGVRACIEYGPACPQVPLPFPGFQFEEIDEDCLYLNVWTPAEGPDERLPVMFWIHGGGFFSGSASQMHYDGAALATKGVVVVTVNYRVGALGFLAHPELAAESPDGLTGNYGLLDQIAGLEWVRRNIAAFGGDPSRVTIFGESSGGMSVAALMLSPMSEGLFHGAIAQSGLSVLARYLFPASASGNLDAALEAGEALEVSLGCGEAPDVLAAMRAKTADEIMLTAGVPNPFFPNTGAMMFLPVADGRVVSEGWLSPTADASWHDVPFIIGTNRDEGSTWVMTPESLARYEAWVREMFPDRAGKLLRLYPGDPQDVLYPSFSALLTAAGWACPARFAAEARADLKSPTYIYEFTHVPESEVAAWGAFHGLEIGYVFAGPRLMLEHVAFTPEDAALSDLMMDYWTAFAATGDPNDARRLYWPGYDPVKDEHLEFGATIAVRTGHFRDACHCLR